jgi:hypothetical protein
LLLHTGWRAALSLASNVDYYSKGIACKIDGDSEASYPENDFP